MGSVNRCAPNNMGTYRSKRRAKTHMNAGFRPDQGAKVRPSCRLLAVKHRPPDRGGQPLPARTGRPTSKLRCSAYSGRSTAGYEQRTRPNPGIWLARLVALKQSLARLSFRTVRLAGERQKQDRSRLGRGGAAHRVSATLSESWSTLRRWPPASVMTGERPAKAEAALHDLTVAKSKRVRPPQNRRMSALRAFETTMPGGVCARAAGLTAPQRLRQST
jgi:hypothetical protein